MGQKGSKEKRPSDLGGNGKRPSYLGMGKAKQPSDLGSIPAQPSPQKLPSETSAVSLTRKASSQQLDDMSVYSKKDALRRTSSAASQNGHKKEPSQDLKNHNMRKPSGQDLNTLGNDASSKLMTTNTINEELVPQQRRTLFDHLVAFYFRNDNERLMNGDVDIEGICDWALSSTDGIASLNEKLRNKYGEDLDSFLVSPNDDEEDDDNVEYKDEDDRSDTSATAEKEKESPNLANDAALDRPAINVARRRPTTTRFILNADGEIDVPADAQLDHVPAPDLKQQLHDFIISINPARVGETERFAKFAEERGLVALNSELLDEFGRDLKGNTMENPTDEGHHNVKKFGVGFDSPVLTEMQTHKLNHEDSGHVEVLTENGACSKFRLDTESAKFGMCKCGHDRAAHMKATSGIKSSTLEKKLAMRRASMNLEEPVVPGNGAFAEVEIPRRPSEMKVSNASDHNVQIPRRPSEMKAASNPPHHDTEIPLRPSELKIPSVAHQDASSKPGAPHPSVKPNPAKLHTEHHEVKNVVEIKHDNEVRPKSRRRPHSKKQEDFDRLQPGEKKEAACSASTFVLDMSATEFGMCAKCGWKKSDHKLETDSVAKPARPSSIRQNGPTEPCNNYRLDLTASSFGACVCGFPKHSHAGQTFNQKALSSTLEKRWSQLKEVA